MCACEQHVGHLLCTTLLISIHFTNVNVTIPSNSFQEVVDESDGCGGKFSTIIVSEQFAGKSLLQRHR